MIVMSIALAWRKIEFRFLDGLSVSKNEFGGRSEAVVGLRDRPLRGQAGVRRHGQW